MTSTSDATGVDASVENKQLRIAVWNYFEKLIIEGQSKCLLCKGIIKHSSNISNLAKVSCIFVFFLMPIKV